MREAIERLRAAVQNQVSRAKLRLASYSATGARAMLQVAGLAGEVLQDVELLLPYGYTAVPAGQTADLLLFQVNGHRDHKVALCADDPACRIAGLQPGEFGLQDNQGQQIVFKRTGIVITTSMGVTINGNLHVTGAVVGGYGGSQQVGLTTHIHNQPADSHGDTEAATDAPSAGT